jgi:lariat debranching enzyme
MFITHKERHFNMNPFDFTMTIPPYDPTQGRTTNTTSLGHVHNPQTETFLQLLDLHYVLESALELTAPNRSLISSMIRVKDENEIVLDNAYDDNIPDDVDDMEVLYR